MRSIWGKKLRETMRCVQEIPYVIHTTSYHIFNEKRPSYPILLIDLIFKWLILNNNISNDLFIVSLKIEILRIYNLDVSKKRKNVRGMGINYKWTRQFTLYLNLRLIKILQKIKTWLMKRKTNGCNHIYYQHLT